jgi:hypothetical protein
VGAGDGSGEWRGVRGDCDEVGVEEVETPNLDSYFGR